MTKYLIPVQACPIVKGHSFSLIIDFEHLFYFLIDNFSIGMYNKIIYKSDEDIKQIYQLEKEHFDIESLVTFLISNDMVFWGTINDINNFPDVESTFDIPYEIDNAIIDIDEKSIFNVEKALTELSDLGCPNLQIRIFQKEITQNFIKDLVFKIIQTSIKKLQFLLPYNLETDCLIEDIAYEQIIDKIIVYNSPNKKILEPVKNKYIIYTDEKSLSEHSCGIVHEDYFIINRPFFTESLRFNTCLNKKISVDKRGEIKNCPSSAISYGNINNKKLAEVISIPEFTSFWNISKENVDICKDCHFRRVCPDCRVYLENPKDPFSKPLKCGYNPYTNEWADWSQNPIKKKVFAQYCSDTS